MKRLLALALCCALLCFPVQAGRAEKFVALTFDDGPSGRFTRALLQGLEERGVKATFLLCGYRMETYPQLTQQIFDSGHEIGLHGYTHNSMDQMCRQEIDQEIRKTMDLLPNGCQVQFLRPPGGKCNATTKAAAESNGLSLLCWSVDPRDWATRDASAIEAQVIDKVRSGDVILLHDMSDSSVKAALSIVDHLLAQGFRFVTVSQLAALQGVAPAPGQMYCRFDG